jgi:hypothetical protein
MRIVSFATFWTIIEHVTASFSLSLLRASTSPAPQGMQASISLDSIAHDSFQAPSIQQYKVEPITSEDIPLLEELSQQADVKKRKD